MTLTIADTNMLQPIELIERSDEIYQTVPYYMDIGRLGKLIELHQLLFSTTAVNSAVRLELQEGISYLILLGGGSTAIYCDFSDAPLLFPLQNRDIIIYPEGVLVKIDITVWYRLIDQ